MKLFQSIQFVVMDAIDFFTKKLCVYYVKPRAIDVMSSFHGKSVTKHNLFSAKIIWISMYLK